MKNTSQPHCCSDRHQEELSKNMGERFQKLQSDTVAKVLLRVLTTGLALCSRAGLGHYNSTAQHL